LRLSPNASSQPQVASGGHGLGSVGRSHKSRLSRASHYSQACGSCTGLPGPCSHPSFTPSGHLLQSWPSASGQPQMATASQPLQPRRPRPGSHLPSESRQPQIATVGPLLRLWRRFRGGSHNASSQPHVATGGGLSQLWWCWPGRGSLGSVGRSDKSGLSSASYCSQACRSCRLPPHCHVDSHRGVRKVGSIGAAARVAGP